MKIEGFSNLSEAWVSLDEYVGTGDGKKNTFRLHMPAEALLSPEVYLDRAAVLSDQADPVMVDGKPASALGQDGKIEPLVVRSGWRIESDGDVATLVLDRIPRFGQRVSVGVIGRGDDASILSFKIHATDASLRELVTELSAKAYKKMSASRDPGKAEMAEMTKYGKAVVKAFIMDWSGIKNDDGSPMPFNEVSLETFCTAWKLPIWEFARWAAKRSGDIAVAEYHGLEDAAKNS